MAEIGAYQTWVKAFDQVRGWDCILPTDTFVHLIEEVGEVGRCLLKLAGYKGEEPPEAVREELAGELADAITFLVKIGYSCGIDVARALEGNVAKCERRYGGPEAERAGVAEARRYLAARREELAALIQTFEDRFGKERPSARDARKHS